MAHRYSAVYDPTAQQKPVRHGLCHTLRKDFHWKCLLLTLLVHACVLYAIWCRLNYRLASTMMKASMTIVNYPGGVCAQGYNFLPLLIGFLLYALYLIECWTNRRKVVHLPKRTTAEVYDLIRRMREAIPIVWWKSVCYHYLRRTRQITRYRNGDAVTATQVYYERVNSHSSGNVFLYDSCGYKDISNDLAGLECYPVISMRFTKGFLFACVQAANEFEDQRTRFFNENEVRDDYMEVREGLDLAELPFVEHILIYATPKTHRLSQEDLLNRSDECEGNNVEGLVERLTPSSSALPYEPWYMKTVTYWIASVLLLSWPLRMLIECRTAHVHYQVTKLFGTNLLSPSSINYTGPLTRTSTMESRELELANRQNFLLIPSYSEAILLDPVMTTTVPPPPPPSRYVTRPQQTRSIHSEFCVRNEPLVSTNESPIFANYQSIDISNGDGISSDESRLLDQCGHNYGALHNGYKNFMRSTQTSPYHRGLQRFLNGIENRRYKTRAKYSSEDDREVIPLHAEPGNSLTKVRHSQSLFFGGDRRKNSLLSRLPPREKRSRDTAFPSTAVPIPRATQLGVLRETERDRELLHRLNMAPTRSVTISGGISFAAESAQPNRRFGEIREHLGEEDRIPLIRQNLHNSGRPTGGSRQHYEPHSSTVGANEPPPPYEIALQMCAPLYERLKRSANSISSLLNSVSNSTTPKDLRQYSLDGPSSNDASTSSYPNY